MDECIPFSRVFLRFSIVVFGLLDLCVLHFRGGAHTQPGEHANSGHKEEPGAYDENGVPMIIHCVATSQFLARLGKGS